MNIKKVIFERIKEYGVVLDDNTELTYKNGKELFHKNFDDINFYGVANDKLLNYIQFRNWQHTGEFLTKGLKPIKNFLNGLFPYPYLYKVWMEEDDED
jgi:hypothetical protein